MFLLSTSAALFAGRGYKLFTDDRRTGNPSGFFRILPERPKILRYRIAVCLLRCDETPHIVHDHGPLVAVRSKQKEL
jgi:hypothetical protein